MREKLLKQAIINAFEYSIPGTRHMGGCKIYDWLIKNGHLTRDDEKIRKYAKEARLESPELLDHDLKDTASIINITKSKIVDEFFSDLRKNGIDIREYL